jgi:hypothetical protein
MFVECIEKTGVVDFGFSGEGVGPVLRGRRQLPEETYNSQDLLRLAKYGD